MKHLRLSLAVNTLALAFAFPAFAGYMDTTITPPSPPPPAIGAMGCSGVSADSATEIALSLLQSVLALL